MKNKNIKSEKHLGKLIKKSQKMKGAYYFYTCNVSDQILKENILPRYPFFIYKNINIQYNTIN